MLILVFFHAVHFYVFHRAIHWPPLYNTVHYLHHANVNPSPWSGLAMHPVEHLIYFSGVLLLWVIPATPIHAIFFMTLVGLGTRWKGIPALARWSSADRATTPTTIIITCITNSLE